jgi:hypothetical protein
MSSLVRTSASEGSKGNQRLKMSAAVGTICAAAMGTFIRTSKSQDIDGRESKRVGRIFAVHGCRISSSSVLRILEADSADLSALTLLKF